MANRTKRLALKAGLGVAAIAAAAGAYYFFGKEGKKHRKKAEVWVSKAKRDVIQELKKLKTVSAKTYKQTVQKVAGKYKKLASEHPEEIQYLTDKLTADWKKIEKHLPREVKSVAKRVIRIKPKARKSVTKSRKR